MGNAPHEVRGGAGNSWKALLFVPGWAWLVERTRGSACTSWVPAGGRREKAGRPGPAPQSSYPRDRSREGGAAVCSSAKVLVSEKITWGWPARRRAGHCQGLGQKSTTLRPFSDRAIRSIAWAMATHSQVRIPRVRVDGRRALHDLVHSAPLIDRSPSVALARTASVVDWAASSLPGGARKAIQQT